MGDLTPLERARIAAAEKRAAGLVIERMDPTEKARKNPNSLRLAVNGKCWECVGAGFDVNPRRAIRECAIVGCTLHAVRPYRVGAPDTDTETDDSLNGGVDDMNEAS